MKKYLLSIFTIGLFGIFLGYQKVQSIEGNQVAEVAPTSLNLDNNNPTTTKNINYPNISTKLVINKPKPSESGTQTKIVTPKSATPEPVIPQTQSTKYKDGTYKGISANAYYGYIQVEAIIKNNQITDIVFLDYPHDQSESRFINSYADPILRSEALSAQSANVAIVSHATDSSIAFRQSLASALSQALNS